MQDALFTITTASPARRYAVRKTGYAQYEVFALDGDTSRPAGPIYRSEDTARSAAIALSHAFTDGKTEDVLAPYVAGTMPVDLTIGIGGTD